MDSITVLELPNFKVVPSMQPTNLASPRMSQKSSDMRLNVVDCNPENFPVTSGRLSEVKGGICGHCNCKGPLYLQTKMFLEWVSSC